MSDYTTNGYLISLLQKAASDTSHSDHSDAKAYYAKFRALEVEFFEKVHPFVDVGLAMNEAKISDGAVSNVFTVHGCRHISDLIKSLDKLSKETSGQSDTPITVLEAYILLCAAHVHDAANVLKREGHPERCNEVIIKYKELFISSACQQIYDVARVHGGRHPDFGKDTFRSLNVDSIKPPRLLLLAAFLRLGDELSENEERVPQPVVAHHEISDRSKLAHAYAKCFNSFELRGEALYIVFGVYPSEHNLSVTIDDKKISFYDFLEEKINVIDKESRYCSQYARPAFHISKINVTVRKYKTERPSQVEISEEFTLSLNHGYPDLDHSLCQRSPELTQKKIMTLAECFSVGARDTVPVLSIGKKGPFATILGYLKK
ncbi:hypothetical protein JIN84_14555 [Luteolibacter yonseiensis]|uniref:HD-CE domain-containing protein n=1 Tax=Luteolibacter yonseiensis TaxID=1144680 RepID=A0A934R1U7_9BACT|nr:hypothetical protein [Luteolibacter yonseiensis]MBK1816843.1 hypothetical protein [Luteolibacter yonseiensis]